MAIRLAQLFRKASPSFRHKDLTPISMAFGAGKRSPSTSNRHFTAVTYFSYVKQVNRIICLSFFLVQALLAADKMKGYSFLTRNLKSISSIIHECPCLPHFPAFCPREPVEGQCGQVTPVVKTHRLRSFCLNSVHFLDMRTSF